MGPSLWIERPQSQKRQHGNNLRNTFPIVPTVTRGLPAPIYQGLPGPEPLTPLSRTSKASLATLRPCWVEEGGGGQRSGSPTVGVSWGHWVRGSSDGSWWSGGPARPRPHNIRSYGCRPIVYERKGAPAKWACGCGVWMLKKSRKSHCMLIKRNRVV